ncbi:MAG: 3-keto-5-aminohexanoate cleavage protein [Deltaproteobacteria bacterium]|nr:3-keto-5-aminohexanoate cleavage protein [Deltaproteobacteria bacterium]
MKDNYFITCALTGGGDTTKKNPNIPITPKEIAQEADVAAKAGASMVHMHVRNPATGLESTDKSHFIEVVDRIRQQGTDVIINLTTAIGTDVVFDEKNPSQLAPGTDFWPPERRLEHIEEAMPDVCSLDVPIMNYADTPYCNLPEHVRLMAKRLKEIKVKPEIECFDLGDLWATQRFIDEGLFDDMLPENCVWGTLGVGSFQMQMVAQSVLLGGNVRVGLEDNLYIAKGKPATNAMLVESAVDIIQRLGGHVGTVKAARKLLNLRIQ